MRRSSGQSTEYIIDLRGIPFKGQKIAAVEIAVIGFTPNIITEVDYIDFSEKPFEKVAPDAVFIP